MADLRVTLTDVARGIDRAEYAASAADLPLAGADAWSVTKRRLHGGPSDGVDVLTVDNGALALELLPTRGMGIWRGRCRGVPLGWQSPVEHPVHPSLVNLTDRGGLGWLHGFNEWLCRCGLAWNGPPGTDPATGAPLTLHGRIANIPAHCVELHVKPDGAGTIAVTGAVDEATVFGPRLRLTSTLSTEAGSSRFRIIDRITNLAGQPGEFQMLYHVNTGRPFLEEGSTVLAPLREVAPRDARAAEGIGGWRTYLGPTTGYAEQVYLAEAIADDHGRTQALLRNAAGELGLSVRWNTRQLPCFSVWKCTQAEADGYVTGLEPATNFPNFKSFERERGRVVKLGPGDSYEIELELEVHTTAAEVASAEAWIEALQRGTTPRLHPAPQKRFSPAG